MELEDGPQPEGYGAGRAAIILVAECVGTGVLALPYVASVLGTGPFLLFVAIQVALNLYAGELLATAAETAERKTNYEACRSTTSALWDFVDDTDNIDWDTGEPKSPTTRPRDMLELAQALDAGRPLRALVASAWYGNLVLILAQYLVVMARSLRVAFPMPGCAVVVSLLIAALTAWLIAQLPTLDALGKGAAQLSFASVVAILAICAKHTPTGPPPVVVEDASAAAVAASLTTVTFAMITSKLFLNVRREMRDPREARKTLRYGIAAFTCVYVVVVFMSGPEPPRFLLDSVGRHSTDARVAAALLYCHVAVSYAINQNVCSLCRIQGALRHRCNVAFIGAGANARACPRLYVVEEILGFCDRCVNVVVVSHRGARASLFRSCRGHWGSHVRAPRIRDAGVALRPRHMRFGRQAAEEGSRRTSPVHCHSHDRGHDGRNR